MKFDLIVHCEHHICAYADQLLWAESLLLHICWYDYDTEREAFQ